MKNKLLILITVFVAGCSDSDAPNAFNLKIGSIDTSLTAESNISQLVESVSKEGYAGAISTKGTDPKTGKGVVIGASGDTMTVLSYDIAEKIDIISPQDEFVSVMQDKYGLKSDQIGDIYTGSDGSSRIKYIGYGCEELFGYGKVCAITVHFEQVTYLTWENMSHHRNKSKAEAAKSADKLP